MIASIEILAILASVIERMTTDLKTFDGIPMKYPAVVSALKRVNVAASKHKTSSMDDSQRSVKDCGIWIQIECKM